MADTYYKDCYVTSQDNLKLYFRDYEAPRSKKTPILCLPGLTRNSKDFNTVAVWLSQKMGHRVISVDYRGRGMSDYDTNWRNYKATTYVQDVCQILTACHIHNVIGIGTSMGGLLCMGLNVLKPRLLKGVVLNDIGPEIENTGLGRIVNYIGIDHPFRSWEEAMEHMRALFPQMMLTGETDWREFAENTFRQKEDGLLHYDWDVKIAKALLDESGALPELWPLFNTLNKKPLLIIRGGVSDLLSENTVNKMLDAHPTATAVTVPNVGHAPTLFEQESQTAIDVFLREVDHEHYPSFSDRLKNILK